MVDGDGRKRGGIAGLAALIGGLVSFRVVIALTTSVSVTAAVAGPLALQAIRMRNEPTEQAVALAPEPNTASSPTPSPSNTASEPPPDSTAPEAQPVEVEGRVTPNRPAASTTTTTMAAAGPTSPTPTIAAVTGAGLVAGVAADRSDAVELDGATLAGRVFIYVNDSDVRSVRWWVDQPDRSGAPTRTATTPPFDLGSPLFDVATLSPGRHRVDAEFDTPSGIQRRVASFDVVR